MMTVPMVAPLASVAERRDYGKSRRQVLHSVDQCYWKPPRSRPDPVELLISASRDRMLKLLPIKWARMAASPTGALGFDIHDFDETIPGPWEWDVKRLATSLVLGGREAGQSDGACKEA